MYFKNFAGFLKKIYFFLLSEFLFIQKTLWNNLLQFFGAKFLCQLAILPTCHFVKLPLHEIAIEFNCKFINLPANKITCHFINLPVHQLTTLTTRHFINCYLTNLHFINQPFHQHVIMSFQQLAISLACPFISVPSLQLTI